MAGGRWWSLVVSLSVLGTAFLARAQAPMKLALLPFENVSGNIESLGIVMPVIEKAVREKGYQIVGREELERFLARRRIRNTGMLSRRHLTALRQEFGVRLAMVGSVDLFSDSGENPQWGLSSRILSTEDGGILWAKSAGLTGADFTTVLGLGTIRSGERLGQEVVKRLLRGLPPAGSRFTVPEAGRSPGFRLFGFKAGYRSPLLDSKPPKRVAVLPFENASERRGAGRILTDIFTTALFQHGRFQVLEPGEVSEALIALRAAPYGAIDFDTLAGLRKRTGVDGVILGTVYTYNEGLKRGATTSPEVALDARMLHTEGGRILWHASHSGSGEDYQVVLDFGTIRSMIPLALKVVREMLESL